VELYAPRLNVQALRKPFVTDVGITAPRYMRGDHYDLSCHIVWKFLRLRTYKNRA